MFIGGKPGGLDQVEEETISEQILHESRFDADWTHPPRRIEII